MMSYIVSKGMGIPCCGSRRATFCRRAIVDQLEQDLARVGLHASVADGQTFNFNIGM